jgi:hypothetical protein
MRRGFRALTLFAAIALAVSSAAVASATVYSGAAATRPEVVLDVSGTRVTVEGIRLACRKPGVFSTGVAFGHLSKARFSFKVGDTFAREPIGRHPRVVNSSLTITGAIRGAVITGVLRTAKGGPCVGGHYTVRTATTVPPTKSPPATPPVTKPTPPATPPVTTGPTAWDPPPAPCNAGDAFTTCSEPSYLLQHHCISTGGDCDAAMCATATDMAVTGTQIALKNAGVIDISSFDPAVPETALIGPAVNAALVAHGAVWLTVGSDNAIFYCDSSDFEKLTYEIDNVPASLSLCVGVTPNVESVVGELTGSALAGATADAGVTMADAVEGAPAASVQGPDGWSASIGLQGACLSVTLNTQA